MYISRLLKSCKYIHVHTGDTHAWSPNSDSKHVVVKPLLGESWLWDGNAWLFVTRAQCQHIWPPG